MTFQCEDLPGSGLVLVPASSPDYEPLLADIQARLDNPAPGLAAMPDQLRRAMFGRISPDKRETSAILLNRSGRSIAALALVWHYEEVNGRTYTHSFTNVFGRSLLLPFLNPGTSVKFQAYWFTILPGSKRYIGEGEMAGDNTDVRMPDADEVWTGGGGFGGGGGGRQERPVRSVTLAIDGVFFTDGTFAGPNQLELWENVTGEAKLRMDVAKMACDGRARGLAARDILHEIGGVTGPARKWGTPLQPGRGSWAARMKEMVATEIERRRESAGGEAAVDALAAQAGIQLPDYRRV